jgi:hypothetical protein
VAALRQDAPRDDGRREQVLRPVEHADGGEVRGEARVRDARGVADQAHRHAGAQGIEPADGAGKRRAQAAVRDRAVHVQADDARHMRSRARRAGRATTDVTLAARVRRCDP